MKTYTAIINWNDNDTEEGTFGVTVRANDFEEAERLARQAMRESYIEQYVRGLHEFKRKGKDQKCKALFSTEARL
jgi:predicted RNase H-like HicB family nuclease